MIANSTEYKQYLASREWATLREQVRRRSGNRCERCNVNKQDAVHHLTYERVGHELLEDLQAICGPCHEFLSAKSDIDPLQAEFSLALDSNGVLLCPFCKNDYTHAERAYGRNDQRVIQFSCEICGQFFEVIFSQHKGNTVVNCCRLEWRSSPSIQSMGAIRIDGMSLEQVTEIKKAIQKSQKFLAELLEHSSRWELEDAELRIYFPPAKHSFAEMMEGREPLERIRSISSSALGRSIRVCARLENIS